MNPADRPRPRFVRARPRPLARRRLFCFPYAGSGAGLFRDWGEGLPSVEVCALQLPGRGWTWREPPFDELPPLIESLALLVSTYSDRPFALFGHSLGALLCFELARALRARGLPTPEHLFVSAHRAPDRPAASREIHRLPDPHFLVELRKLGGTPPEVLHNDELMQLMLPALRADFALSEGYAYQAQEPLECPITAFGGLVDRFVSRESLEAWKAHTSAAFALRMLPGDHFFLPRETPAVWRAVTLGLESGPDARGRL